MSEPLQPTLWPETELASMSSAAASHARTSAAQEREQALKASVPASGRNTPDLLANYDLDSSSWRTSQRSFLEGWTVFSETWPRSGLMRSGIAFRLPPLAPLTDGIASGLWPTPHGFSQDGRSNGPSGNELGRAVNQSLWPTPGGTRPHDTDQVSGRLANEIGGSLNPTWVEWLMGFPSGWTVLELSATPSCRRSPS